MMVRNTRLRGGIGLLEMVHVIAITGLLLSLSSVVLGNAIRAHQLALESYHELKSLQRFADRFRRDVEQAVAISSPEAWDGTRGVNNIELNMKSARIAYRFEPDQIIRTVTQPDGVEARQTWRLADGGVGNFRVAAIDPTGANPSQVAIRPMLIASIDYGAQSRRPPQAWLVACPPMVAAPTEVKAAEQATTVPAEPASTSSAGTEQ